jgi:hypothetical protein
MKNKKYNNMKKKNYKTIFNKMIIYMNFNIKYNMKNKQDNNYNK